MFPAEDDVQVKGLFFKSPYCLNHFPTLVLFVTTLFGSNVYCFIIGILHVRRQTTQVAHAPSDATMHAERQRSRPLLPRRR